MLGPLIRILFGLLVFVLIVDPADLIFHLKTPLFAMVFLLWMLHKAYTPFRYNKEIILVILLFFAIPLYGIGIALIQGNFDDPDIAVGFAKSFSIFLLAIVVYDMNIDTAGYLNKNCIVIPLIIIPIYILMLLNPMTYGVIYNYLNFEKNVAMFSMRNFFGFQVVMLYYKTSALMVFPLAYYCQLLFKEKRKRLLSFILVSLFSLTLFLSGTRANMLSAIVIVGFYWLSMLWKKNRALVVGILSAAAIGIFFFAAYVIANPGEKADTSAEVKSGHFQSLIRNFEDHPAYLIWGQGIGSQIFSTGSGAITSQTELTYVELVRWFGGPVTLLLMLLIIYPFFYLSKNKRIESQDRYLLLAFPLYLFIAGTNPLLISSTGMIVIINMYSFIGKYARLKNSLYVN